MITLANRRADRRTIGPSSRFSRLVFGEQLEERRMMASDLSAPQTSAPAVYKIAEVQALVAGIGGHDLIGLLGPNGEKLDEINGLATDSVGNQITIGYLPWHDLKVYSQHPPAIAGPLQLKGSLWRENSPSAVLFEGTLEQVTARWNAMLSCGVEINKLDLGYPIFGLGENSNSVASTLIACAGLQEPKAWLEPALLPGRGSLLLDQSTINVIQDAWQIPRSTVEGSRVIQSLTNFTDSSGNQTEKATFLDGGSDLETLSGSQFRDTLFSSAGMQISSCTGTVSSGMIVSASFSGAGGTARLSNATITVAMNSDVSIDGNDLVVSVQDRGACVVKGVGDTLTGADGRSVTTTSESWIAVSRDKLVYGTPQLIAQFSTQLGDLIGGNDALARLTTSAALTKASAELVKLAPEGSILNPGPAGKSYLDTVFDDTFGNNGGPVVSQLSSSVYTAVTSLLVADAAQSRHLKGFDGQVLTASGATISQQLYSNVNSGNDVLQGFSTSSITGAFGVNLGDLVGSKLASGLIDAHGIGQQLFASVGGSYAGITAGAQIGAGIASSLSIPTGSVALATATFAEIAGSVLFPIVGTIIGSVAGQFLGSAIYDFANSISFGLLGRAFGGGSTWAYQSSIYDTQTHHILSPASLLATKNTNSSIRNDVAVVTNAIDASVNSILDLLHCEIDTGRQRYDNDLALVAYVGANKKWGSNQVQIEYINGNHHLDANGDYAKLVRSATVYDISNLHLFGGDPILTRAVNVWKSSLTDNTDPNALASLYATLQVAQDYEKYLKSTAIINSMIEADASTPFARGWWATLAQAEALGLSKPEPVRFDVSAPASVSAGNPFSVTVTVVDQQGHPQQQYSGTMNFGGGDGTPLRQGYQFTAADHGSHTFDLTQTVSGTQTIYAVAADSTFGQFTVNVRAGRAVKFDAVLASALVPGQANTLTIRVVDAYGNVVTGYRGTVSLSTNDQTASLPSSFTFTESDAGTHQFDVTFETNGLQTELVRGRHKKLYSRAKALDVIFASPSEDFAPTTIAIQ